MTRRRVFLAVVCLAGAGVASAAMIWSGDDAASWGLGEVVARPSAGGYMLDVRFRVLDGEKAAPFFDERFRPVLVSEKTGARFVVPCPPKVGQLRHMGSAPEGRTCFMMFANPGGYVKPGDLVTVEVGPASLRHVRVE